MQRLTLIVVCAAGLLAGCAQNFNGTPPTEEFDGLRLLAITTLEPDASGEGLQLRAFVQPARGFEAVWLRFELYVFVPLDANPRGKRLMLWPQIEPGPARINNPNWRPHLEAYEFVLPIEPKPSGKVFLVEVTAMGQDGIRRSALLKLKTGQPKAK